MASIQDVAKKAKVGVGTVSRVLSGNGYVADATRKKVQKAIKELDYKPNELARNLLHNKTNIIAVIIPDVANPYFATLVNEMEKELRKYGYKTMLCNTVGEKTNEEAYLDMLNRNMVDGVLTGTHTLDNSHYEKIKRPIVGFDTAPLAPGVPVIAADHATGGRMAAEAMIRSGCKEVVQFSDDIKMRDYPFIERHKEFARVCRSAGLICHTYFVKWNNFDNQYFQEIIKDCFEKYPNADGAFGTDSLACYYLKYALMKGNRVPEDVKVVAYDGTSVLSVVYPEISAVIQPIQEIARTGVEQLLNIINGQHPEKDLIRLDVTFRQGMTTTGPN